MPFLDEAQLEIACVDLLKGLGYAYAHGPEIAHDGERPERSGYGEVILKGRLREALGRINPKIPAAALDEAVRKVGLTESASLIENNRTLHKLLTDGVDVSYQADGREVHDKVWLIDFDTVSSNDLLVVNQFTVIEDRRNRRADVVVFVNGLPLGLIELKNPAAEQATLRSAYNQLQTYKRDIPSLLRFNEALVISDGLDARVGTLTAGWDRFMPWRTVDGAEPVPGEMGEMEILLRGMFEPQRFLDLVRYFNVFETDGQTTIKKLAAYHQYHAVNKAVDCTVQAASPEGDRRIGVVWHTQGSGKSLSMAFYAGKIIQHPAMENPTLVILTDRNDLDEQLFGTFCGCEGLLRQTPEQAGNRAQLREMLQRGSGGVIFTTIQKFMPEAKGDTYPELSDRRNIVVIADEAHRSQYDFIDGYARHMRDAMPHASFIGFTGTPIEAGDRSTPAVFGEYVDVYDIERAVQDGATVPIYYESRLAKIVLDETAQPDIDPDFEEVTEGEEEQTKQKLASKWARLEAMVGTETRLGLVAEDLVAHFEDRLAAMDGKAMIVAMSRRICVDLYTAITKLRPEWHAQDDAKGAIKVVMTGSASDPVEWQQHIRPKSAREKLAKRFKDPDDPLKLVIVRDMWLTGFDCPSAHTMYVDKPMRGHGLMQAIARVNRVFKDKPGGLVVDYLGLADQLKQALANYTASGGRGRGAHDQNEAVAIMQEKFEVVTDMLHGYDWQQWLGAETTRMLVGLRETADFICGLDDGKQRFMQTVTELSKAFALAVPHDAAIAIRDEVGFFQAVRSALAKTTRTGGKSKEELDSAVRQIVSKAVSSDEVIDVFDMAGLKKPDISILSDQFLAEVRGMPQRNLAVEVLQKLLNDEIKVRSKRNVVEARRFSEMLEEAVRKYQNRAIETAKVIEELISLAKEMNAAQLRGDLLGLNEDEVAFYDALEVNDSAVKVLGDDTLRDIARDLVQAVRRNTSIDWSVKENVRAKLRVIVKRILRRYGYPPDKCEKATDTVLEQAEVLCSKEA
jgi:type I restriction enzyme R subunit